MQNLISDMLRGSVSYTMNMLLLFTLTRSTQGRRSTFLISALYFVINMASTFWFYIYSDLTSLSHFSIVLYIVLGLSLKLLSRTSFMQWSFNFLTTVNIGAIIIILSFHLGKLFPYPQYVHTLIRFLLYLLIIVMFRRYLQPFYNSVSNNWRIYSLLVICIFLNLSYYFVVTTDIQHTLLASKWPLLLLSTLSLTAYGTIFYAMRRLTAMHALETEHLKDLHERALLSQAASTMTERLQFMEKLAHEHSLLSHDRRHFNNMLLGLLQQGEIAEAMTCLRKQNEIKMQSGPVYCENNAVNAVVSYYLGVAEQKGLHVKANLSLAAELPVDSLEMALVVANLLENAIQGVLLLPEERRDVIHLSCRQVGRLLLEITNPCMESVILGVDGLPHATQEGHGVGTKSIAAFAAKYGAELLYAVRDGRFRVRLLI